MPATRVEQAVCGCIDADRWPFADLSKPHRVRSHDRRSLARVTLTNQLPRTSPTVTPAAAASGAGVRLVAALLLPLRLFLAAGWLRAGVEKVIEPSWWTGAALDRFLVEQETTMLPFFRWFSDLLIEPLTVPVAWLVVAMQLTIGVCLLLGRFPRRALWAGVVLNLCFTMAGRVNPSAFYLVMELALLVGLSRPVSLTIAWRRATLWLVPALVMLPFARTIEPAEAIEDPALMIAFVSGLAAVSSIAWSAAHLRFPVGWIDLLPRAAWSDRVRRMLERGRDRSAR